MAVPHVRACSWGARLQLSRSGRAWPWIGFAIAELICMARSGAYIYLINMTKNQQSFSPITTQGSQSEQFQAIAKPIQARPDNQARPMHMARYGRRPPCAPSNRTDREWAVVRLELWLGGLGPVGSPVGLATALPPMARAHIHNHRYLHAFDCTRCHQGLRVTYTACAHVDALARFKRPSAPLWAGLGHWDARMALGASASRLFCRIKETNKQKHMWVPAAAC